jgi:F-box-like
MSAEAGLPNEILGEIFLHSLPHPLDYDGRLDFQAIRSVCPTWRMVAFSSPILWSSIDATDEFAVPLPGGKLISLLSEWFSRAGPTILLDLKVRFSEDQISEDEEIAEAALVALIGRFQPRWKTLYLSVSQECFWDCIHSPPSTNWDSLQTLTLLTSHFTDLSGSQVAERMTLLKTSSPSSV